MSQYQLSRRLKTLTKDTMFCDHHGARFLLNVANRTPPAYIAEHNHFRKLILWARRACTYTMQNDPFSPTGHGIVTIGDLLEYCGHTTDYQHSIVCNDDAALLFTNQLISIMRRHPSCAIYCTDVYKIRSILNMHVFG